MPIEIIGCLLLKVLANSEICCQYTAIGGSSRVVLAYTNSPSDQSPNYTCALAYACNITLLAPTSYCFQKPLCPVTCSNFIPDKLKTQRI